MTTAAPAGATLSMDPAYRLVTAMPLVGCVDAGRRAPRQDDRDVLHHALVLMVEDMAVEHELADIALVAGAHLQRIALLDPYRVLPHALEAAILRVGPGERVETADVAPLGIEDRDDLERIDVDVE